MSFFRIPSWNLTDTMYEPRTKNRWCFFYYQLNGSPRVAGQGNELPADNTITPCALSEVKAYAHQRARALTYQSFHSPFVKHNNNAAMRQVWQQQIRVTHVSCCVERCRIRNGWHRIIGANCINTRPAERDALLSSVKTLSPQILLFKSISL